MEYQRYNRAEERPHQQFESPHVCWCKDFGNLRDMIKSSVREEMDALRREMLPHLPPAPITTPVISRSPPCQAASKRLFLHIDDQFLPKTLFTLNKIQEQVASFKVELHDECGVRVEDGPESSLKIRIIVVDGDCEVEDNDWTEDVFSSKLVQPRKDKGPLLKGDCNISLSGGVASIEDICFTDNTNRIKIRFGFQVVKAPSGVFIRAAVSKPFIVKERRLQSEKKHETPSLGDPLWRLRNVRKDGPVYLRAKEAKIYTVKDFLRLYHTDAEKLQNILKVPETKWKEIVKNAKACVLSSNTERFICCDDTIGVGILLDCVFNIECITYRGHISLLYESLDDHNKEIVNKLRRAAYENPTELEPYNSTDQLPMPAIFPSLSTSSIPPLIVPHLDITSVQQGELEMQPSRGLHLDSQKVQGHNSWFSELERQQQQELQDYCNTSTNQINVQVEHMCSSTLPANMYLDTSVMTADEGESTAESWDFTRSKDFDFCELSSIMEGFLVQDPTRNTEVPGCDGQEPRVRSPRARWVPIRAALTFKTLYNVSIKRSNRALKRQRVE